MDFMKKLQDEKKKIIMITGEFFPMRGGVADYSYNISKELAKKYDVIIITSENNLFKDEFSNRENIGAIEGLNIGDNIKLFPIIKTKSFKTIPKIVKIIRFLKPDIIIVQYVPYMYNYYGLPIWLVFLFVILKLFRHKICLRIHEVAVTLSYNPIYLLVGLIQRLIIHNLWLLTDIGFINMLSFAKMIKFSKDKIRIIPVCSSIEVTEEEDIKIKAEAAELKREISENGKFFIISTYGSDAYYKRYDILLEVLIKNDNLKLLYIGKGNELRNLVEKKCLENRVIITGYIKHRDVYKYLISSDIFIFFHSDIRGGVGTKSSSLITAFYAGLPVIGCSGKMTDNFYFKHLENIYLLNDCSEQAVSKAILEVLNNKELTDKISHGAKNAYQKFFSAEKIADQYIKNIDNFLQNKKN